MPPSSLRAVAIGFLFLTLLLAVPRPAQTDQMLDDRWDNYLKSLLVDYYTGKLVRARIAIPANGHGLEMIDGQLDPARLRAAAEAAAQPGDALRITRFRFKGKSLEIQFDGAEPAGEGAATPGAQAFIARPAKPRSAARLRLRFSRDIAWRDLTVPNINRLLAAALDLSALSPQQDQPPAANSVATKAKQPDAATANHRSSQPSEAPTPTIIANLPGASSQIGELTIECSTGRARLYIDSSYSGWTARTVRLRAGVHSILILSEGYAPWEQKFSIPAGKLSLVRAEIIRTEQ
jgi:hypothetical protein